MKVAHEVVGRTQPSSRGLDYFRDSSDLAARGLQQLAGSLGNLGEIVDRQNQKNEAFAAEASWSEFETDLAVRQANNARESDPSDPTFYQRSEQMFDNFAGQYLATKVPPALRAQYEARIAEKKRQFVLGTFEYDLKQKDAWQTEKITDFVTKGQLQIDKDWSDAGVDKVRKQAFDMIDASTLSAADKAEKKRNVDLLFLQQQYKKTILQNERNGKPVTESKAVGGSRGKQLAFVMHELNGTESATGARLKGAKTLREAVRAGIGYERPQGWTPQNPEGGDGFKERYVYAQQVLAGKAPKPAMEARAYFESQGLTPEQASGMVGNLMQESGPNLNPAAIRKNDAGPGLHSIGIGQWNRDRLEAMQKFSGQSGDVELPDPAGLSVDEDPRFAGIPLEFREAAREDALRQRNAMLAEQERADKESYAAFLNQKQLEILKGQYGKADMFADFESGRIRDYGDLRSLEEHFDKRNKMDEDLNAGRQSLIQGRAPTDGQFNAVAKDRDWVDRLWNGDKKAANEIWQTAAQVDDTAPVVRNVLGAMLGNRDPIRAQFAYDVLKGLYTADADGGSFKKLPDEIKAKVLLYNELTKTMNASEAIKMIRGGETPDEVFKTEQVREQAKKAFGSPEVKGPEIARNKLNSMLDPFGPTGSSALKPQPWAEYEFQSWYQTWWTENYVKTRDAGAATAATDALADKVWTVSNAGGIPTLMMYAPESIGLPKFGGGYEWLREQAMQQLGLNINSKFVLVADDLTRTEIANWKAGGARELSRMEQWGQTFNDVLGGKVFDVAPYPSWKALVLDEDGLPRMSDQPSKRIRFSPTPELIERDEAEQRFKDIEDRWLELSTLYEAQVEEARKGGPPVDPELQKMKDEIDQKYLNAKEEVDPPNLAPGIPPERVLDPAGEYPQFGTEQFVPGDTPQPRPHPTEYRGTTTYPIEQIQMTSERFGVSLKDALKILRERNVPRTQK